jgi:dTDP-4-dehydrorhamnose reductase
VKRAKPRIVIIGAGGRLGAALAKAYAPEAEVIAFTHAQLDLAQPQAILSTLEPLDFDSLVNAAALTNVDYCEDHRAEAMQLNAEAPQLLAEICQAKKARIVHISTDYVFDGKKREPYIEEDPASPISVYGESKREGELRVLRANPEALVLRVSWVFGPDRPSFIDGIIKRAQENEHIDAIADKFSTPTYALDIAGMFWGILDGWSRRAIARDGLTAARLQGILHFANSGECTWQEYAQWALDCCQEAGLPLKAKRVGVRKLTDMTNWVARRPVYSVLSSAKYTKLTGRSPRAWRDAVADYIRHFYSKQ